MTNLRSRQMNESVQYHDLPVTGIDAMAATTARAYPRHSHDQYGIGVVDGGRHTSWSGRGQVEAGVGELICCNPGEVTDGRALGGRARSWRLLYFELATLRALCVDVLDGAQSEFTFSNPVFQSRATRALFDRAYAHAGRTGESHAVACESDLLMLIAGLQTQSTDQRTKRPMGVSSVRRAKNRIDANPSTRITLSELADDEGLSRYQLIRAFARQTGLTPHAYIVQRRIDMARRLLRSGHGIAEAAVLAGFYDQSHFTRCFVRQFGIPPRRYVSRTATV